MENWTHVEDAFKWTLDVCTPARPCMFALAYNGAGSLHIYWLSPFDLPGGISRVVRGPSSNLPPLQTFTSLRRRFISHSGASISHLLFLAPRFPTCALEAPLLFLSLRAQTPASLPFERTDPLCCYFCIHLCLLMGRLACLPACCHLGTTLPSIRHRPQ